ncbi:MAG TPA: hypothetical protein VEA60_05055 [Allosphingosinicella sp.]|nr:hypothetical protein [Allosphingosinicella sp.]
MSRARRFAVLLLAAAASAAPAGAQDGDRPTLSIGRISSVKSCTLYQETAGRAGLVVTPYAAAGYASWRTWWVKDCVDNFATMRASLEAALAASGGVDLGPRGDYVVSATLSDVSGGPGAAAPNAPDMGEGGFSYSTNGMRINVDVSVRDRGGRVVFGTLLTKTIETGFDTKVGRFQASANESGQALYGRLQHEVALAVARAVAFRFTPLRVVGGDGRQVQLNYGAPLLALGTIVEATSPDGTTMVRYNVVSAADGSALARVEGGGDSSRIVAGSRARVIEPDDPAANARLFDRVELP